MSKERRQKVRREQDKWLIYEPRIRDAVIFIVGVGGVINELFILESPRSVALVFLASLIGVPFVLSADERRRPEKSTDA